MRSASSLFQQFGDKAAMPEQLRAREDSLLFTTGDVELITTYSSTRAPCGFSLLG